ncbi:MAG: heat-inducible transcriptional repressor HrcA [Acidobacteriia bacterium]|nr:heat-inducible transcriptional repressor HrcA [Terriglobia bacterium]
MPKEPRIHAGIDLDPREREILRSVIQAHILTGEPVGSRTVSRERGLDLSPATIRNIMSDLAEKGLLAQPHTSAGRVPTDRGYRLYVDRLMGPARMAPAQAQAIDDALVRSRGEIPELLGEASRQLSRFSNHVGVVLAPELRRIVVEHLEFVRLERQRVVAILVDRAGVVHNRILDMEEPLEQEELDRIGRHLSEQYSGFTLPRMREAVLRRMSEETAQCDHLVAASLELGRRAVDLESASDLFVEGASNLLGSPEFANLQRMRSLFRTLEEKSRLVELLNRILEGEGVQVVIGRENPVSDLSDLSVVASTYGAGDRVMGTVGIVGPTRMEYARAIALVEHLARVLTRLLSSPGE